MSVIVINPKDGHEIMYTEEEYGKPVNGIGPWKTLSKRPMKTSEIWSSK